VEDAVPHVPAPLHLCSYPLNNRRRSDDVQGRSQDFTLGGTEAERRRCENRDAKGADGVGIGEGVSSYPKEWGSGERRELPKRDPGRSPDRQRIFGIFEAHRTLLVERTVPIKSVFFCYNNPLSTIGGKAHWPLLTTPLMMPTGGEEMAISELRKSLQ